MNAMPILIALLMSMIFISPVLGYSKYNKNNNLCRTAAQHTEKKNNIPADLLRAISLTESGRWVEEDKANIAWPWTVASGGAGKFFQSRAEAVRYVHTLQAKGVTNIDVGCMQINLRYHPKAFNNLNEAFDPYQNVKYAGEFLTRLFKESKSWSLAAGRYHSSEPKKGMYYREKVMAFWNQLSRGKGEKTPPLIRIGTQKKSYRPSHIDRERTELLNNSLRSRLNKQKKAFKRAQQMNNQVSDWRNSRGLSNYGALAAARQKALYQQKQKKSLMVTKRPRRGLKKRSFENRRSAQLDQWRETVANPELVALTQRKIKTETTQPHTLLE